MAPELRWHVVSYVGQGTADFLGSEIDILAWLERVREIF
jgi:hypothetical protein